MDPWNEGREGGDSMPSLAERLWTIDCNLNLSQVESSCKELSCVKDGVGDLIYVIKKQL